MAASKHTKLKTTDLVLIAVFTAVMAFCAWITVPSPVPFTMQTFGIFLTVNVLGGKRGFFSVLVYLLMGITGIPVFSGFTGGISCLFGATGGYIIGFLLAATVMWLSESLRGKKPFSTFIFMAVGMIICYIFGTVWFTFFYGNSSEKIGLWTAVTYCVFPYIIPDAIKLALAYAVSGKIKKACKF